MRILYISNGSNFLSAGGMEYHLMDITSWLEGKGVESGLAVRKGTFIHQKLLAGRRNVFPLSWTGMDKLFSFIDLVKAVRDFRPDIISINRERDIIRVVLTLKFLGAFRSKRPKLAAVFHNRGWQKWHWILTQLDGIIFPNTYLRNIYLGEENCAGIKNKVIYHGIRLPAVYMTDKLDRNRKRRYFADRAFPIIGMVGELRKNQSELVDVAYRLKQRIPRFTVAIVGSGNEDEVRMLQKKINNLGLTDHFLLTGNVERSRIPDIFYDLDISVTTNRQEPFGMVFLESLAAGTPLVAFDSGGPVEILDKGGGVLVHGGAEEMAKALGDLISDHEKRNALGREGRSVAERYFSIDAMGEAHYQFYRELLLE